MAGGTHGWGTGFASSAKPKHPVGRRRRSSRVRETSPRGPRTRRRGPLPSADSVKLPRLLLANGLIRVGAAASGQLFAFALADRTGAGGGAVAVAAIGVCFYATELVVAPFAGQAADRRGPLRTLAAGPWFGALSGGIALSSLGPALTGAALLVLLALARTAEGLSAALTVPSTLMLLAQATDHDGALRSRIMGLFEISSLVAMILGYALAGVLWDVAAAGSFAALPVVYLAARGAIGATPRDVRAGPTARIERPALSHAARAFVGAPRHLAFGAAWLAVNAVVGAWMLEAPYLLKLPVRSQEQALVGGFSGGEIGLIFAGWAGTFLLGIGAWTAFGAKLPRRHVLRVSLVAMLGVAGCLTVVNHGGGRVWVFAAALCVLVESGFTPAALAHLADLTAGDAATSKDAHVGEDGAEVTRGHRGAAMGIYSLILGAGQLVGGVLGGPLAERWQMSGLLALTALLALFALIAVHLAGIGEPRHGERGGQQA